MSYSSLEIWFLIVALAIGTFLLRFSFLGVLGDRPLPPFVMKMLRYTAVAVLPAIIVPLVVWPAEGGGQIDPSRMAAALVTLGLGIVTRSTLIAIAGGALSLGVLSWLL